MVTILRPPCQDGGIPGLHCSPEWFELRSTGRMSVCNYARHQLSFLQYFLQDCPRLAAWVSEASQRRSVRASCVSPVPNLAYDKDLLWV